MSNFEYFKTTSGYLKCVSIVLISITVVLSSLSTLTSNYVKNRDDYKPLFKGKEVNLWREIYLIASSAVCFILSVVNFGVHLASKNIYWDPKTALYDFFYHVAGFLLLSTSGVLHIVSGVRLFGINCTTENECQEFELKIAAGGIALISALVCGVVAAVVLTHRKYVERDGLLGDTK